MGGLTYFFTKNNIGLYMKAESENFKLFYIELKKSYLAFKILQLKKMFPIQTYGT